MSDETFRYLVCSFLGLLVLVAMLLAYVVHLAKRARLGAGLLEVVDEDQERAVDMLTELYARGVELERRYPGMRSNTALLQPLPLEDSPAVHMVETSGVSDRRRTFQPALVSRAPDDFMYAPARVLDVTSLEEGGKRCTCGHRHYEHQADAARECRWLDCKCAVFVAAPESVRFGPWNNLCRCEHRRFSHQLLPQGGRDACLVDGCECPHFFCVAEFK